MGALLPELHLRKASGRDAHAHRVARPRSRRGGYHRIADHGCGATRLARPPERHLRTRRHGWRRHTGGGGPRGGSHHETVAHMARRPRLHRCGRCRELGVARARAERRTVDRQAHARRPVHTRPVFGFGSRRRGSGRWCGPQERLEVDAFLLSKEQQRDERGATNGDVGVALARQRAGHVSLKHRQGKRVDARVIEEVGASTGPPIARHRL
eukprot:3441022-Prymnesium_polylepis.1